MSVLGILFGQKRTIIGGKDDGVGGVLSRLSADLPKFLNTTTGIVVDATISEEHTSSCDLTENPVEDGAKVTDHVQLKPSELTIEGVISDSPLGYAIIGNIQNLVRSAENLFGKSSRSTDAFNELLKLQKSRQPFTVVTGLKRYTNMIMTELKVPRTATTGGSIHFTATMKEIRIVKSKSAGIGSLSDSVSDLGSPTKDLGGKISDTVPKTSPVGPTSNQSSSYLNGIGKWAGGSA